MRYVLDASVAIKWFLLEPDSDKALEVREGFDKGQHELLSPDIFAVEVAHALTRAERARRITSAEGSGYFRILLAGLPALVPYLPLMGRAYDLSSASRIGVYDCLYVALAEREGCPLLTADDRLKRTLPGAPITLLSSLP